MPTPTTQPRRRTRAEAQAQTRQRLRTAALELFVSDGFALTSVEAIAERAGYTRGAFYSNFSDKEQLFLSLAMEKLEEQIDSATEMLCQSSPERLLADLRSWRRDAYDPDWVVLLAELRAHALRRPAVRAGLAERERREREAYAAAIRALFDAAELPTPVAADRLAVMVQALANAVPVQHLIDPDDVGQDAVFDMLDFLAEAGLALSASRGAARSR